MLIKDIVFSIIDTETTGGRQNIDRPIEVAVINWTLSDGFIGQPKSWLIDPRMPIHPSAMAVHHIMPEELINKPTLEDIKPELLRYIDGTVLVAHNAQFDLSMLPFLKNDHICSLRLAKHIYKIGDLNIDNMDLTSHKSQELRYWLKVVIDTMGLAAHRAAADILVTGEVFGTSLKKCLEISGITTFEELIEFVNAPMTVDKMTFGKFKGEPLSKVDNGYFKYLLNKSAKNEMQIDEDLKQSIYSVLKMRGIDPMDLIEGANKGNSWAEIANNRKQLSLKK